MSSLEDLAMSQPVSSVLITGNMGYIGPVIASRLREVIAGVAIAGLDTGYFATCLTPATVLPETRQVAQYFCDVRDTNADVFFNCDAIVHLAAISNDPMGRSYERATVDVNHRSTVRLAAAAKKAGVRSFVFASSCSVYGEAEEGPRREQSVVRPLTAYARSKVSAESDLSSLADENFTVTSLRFATACGMSPRLRLDLVLNDFVASALTTGRVEVLSDGSPWRPLIHVQDMARAVEWAITRSGDSGGSNVVVNVGNDLWNFQVKDLAEAVASELPGVGVSINRDAKPDTRSYQVDFSLFRRLAPDHQPTHELHETIRELAQGISLLNFDGDDFRGSDYIRLRFLSSMCSRGLLTEELRWA
jgi:nucleoside-diphosphate-sugar epimerase